MPFKLQFNQNGCGERNALIIFHASFSKRRANGRFTSHLGVISLSASYPTSSAVGTYSSRGRTYIYGRRNKKNGRVDFILYTQTDRFRTTKRCCCRCSCSFLLLYNTAQASSLCGLGAGHVTMVGSQSDEEDQPRPLGGAMYYMGMSLFDEFIYVSKRSRPN